MKLIILVACALVAIAVAGPPDQPQIVRSSYNQEPEGGYVYSFETQDGVQKEETGQIKVVPNEKGEPQKVVVVRGSFSYTDPEGHQQNIAYVANELGFQAEGPSIPKVESRR